MSAVADTTDLVLRAADLRASGGTWASITRKLDLSESELRRLLADRRAEYRKAIAAARRDAIEEGFSEAVFGARKLLRSDDEKVAERASASLFRMFASLNPAPHRTSAERAKALAERKTRERSDEFVRVADYWASLPEWQAEELMDRAYEQEVERRVATRAAGTSPASAGAAALDPADRILTSPLVGEVAAERRVGG